MQSLLSKKTNKAIAAWEAIRSARAAAHATVLYNRPAKGFTVREFANEHNVTMDAADHKVRRLFERRLFGRVLVQIPDSTGHGRLVYVYTEKKHKKGTAHA
jgi:methionine-rich copper-binding protein CopC